MGIVVNDFLVDQFPNIVDYNFTARVEEEFDTIAEGKTAWSGAIGDFYQRFHPEVERATHERPAQRVGQRILGVQPSTRLQVSVSIGRYGPMAQLGTAEDARSPALLRCRRGSRLRRLPSKKPLRSLTYRRISVSTRVR